MRSLMDDLADAVRERRAVLFAGAGLSMSVGLPSWKSLVGHMRAELGLKDTPGWEDASYQTLAEYYRIKMGSIGPLRSWMDRKWSVSEERVKGSVLHELIVDLDFPIIYTTNYDNNLEVAHRLHDRPFEKIANVRDLAKAPGRDTQIIKFHGDFEDDESLVIAETDYFNRLTFESPLDVKFRADALARPILFIGYSLSDLNIRLLLHRLWQIWRDSGSEDHRPRSYVFMTRPSPVQEAVLNQWGISVLTGDGDDPQIELQTFLTALKEAVQGK
jgi:hypothetical protein